MSGSIATARDDHRSMSPRAAGAARTWLRRIESAGFALALAALFAFAVLFRFLLLGNGFPNDHFLYLASAQQIVLGEWPTRDFLDPGLPLMYVVSALSQLALGRTLFAEAVLVSVAFGLAAVLTAAAVRELTGSRLLALVAAALEIVIVPRTYGYPKLLVYAATFFLLQRYVTRHSTGRLLALATAVAVAFLFRHDHGIYLGIAGALAVALARDVTREGWRDALRFVGAVALLIAPYLWYVQMHGGVAAYLRVGLDFRAGELARQQTVWPSLFGDERDLAALLYGYWAFPIAAALLLVVYRRRDDARTIVARVAPLVVVALLIDATFLRAPLHIRLPDAVVPALIIGAWLTACAWRARHRWIWRPVSALLAVVLASSVIEVGTTADHFVRAGLVYPSRRWPEFVAEATTRLRGRYSEKQMPSRPAAALMPFYPYVDRCTKPEHRLLIVGALPEVLFFTQRGFAGGMPAFVGGYYGGETYQQTVLRRLPRQTVPFVLVPGEAYASNFAEGFPLVAAYVRERYVPLVSFGDDPATGVQVLVDRTLPVHAHDGATGWPCWK